MKDENQSQSSSSSSSSSSSDDAMKEEAKGPTDGGLKASASNGDGDELGSGWSHIVMTYVDEPLIRGMHKMSSIAVHRPWWTIWTCVTVSLLLFVLGLFTNFTVDTDEDTLYTPRGSRPLDHSSYIENDSGFPAVERPFRILVHGNGGNVVTVAAVEQAFAAINTVRETKNYNMICPPLEGDDAGGESCTIEGVTRFWNNDYDAFLADGITTDEEMQQIVSQSTYPDGIEVDLPTILGNAEVTDEQVVTSAQSLSLTVYLPESEKAEDFEADAIDNLESLRDQAQGQRDAFQIEYFTERSFEDEFERAIVDDTVLIPIVFILMAVYTCIVFSKCDAVQSRSLLGFGAVCSVLLALCSGYGLLFLIGTPLTSMTQILPFIIFGIGLDDAFILSGAYFRTNPEHSIENRIHEMVQKVGLSIFLTTFTSTLAFGLGAISTIPVVYWLCLYAFPTILFDFIYQLTFFVALMVIDERRVADKRRDCCVCCSVKREDEQQDDSKEQENTNCFVKGMEKFADFLMKPVTKIAVVMSFCGLFIFLAYRTAQLTQEFQFTDVVPSDSYVADYWDSFSSYSGSGGITTRAYFRFVDQSQPEVQEQMEKYVNDLVGIDAISRQPVSFWLRDFKQYISDNGLENVAFSEQITSFLSDPVYQDLYSQDIVVDEDGNVFESRVVMEMDQVDQERVEDQINALLDQRSVSEAQPINRGKSDWAFFTFDSLYFIWEFYAVARDELIFTTIMGVVAVTVVAFALVPHWSAALFVFPFISMCYIDLLGALQLAGLHVNVVSYITLVMSIGLLVDFLMHTLLAYFESPGETREDKVRHALSTMGSSIFIGAVSTLLGVVPLAFSTSEIFRTVFISFIALVLIGAGHGLIFLPVVLSLWGPLAEFKHAEEQYDTNAEENNKEKGDEEVVVNDEEYEASKQLQLEEGDENIRPTEHSGETSTTP